MITNKQSVCFHYHYFLENQSILGLFTKKQAEGERGLIRQSKTHDEFRIHALVSLTISLTPCSPFFPCFLIFHSYHVSVVQPKNVSTRNSRIIIL